MANPGEVVVAVTPCKEAWLPLLLLDSGQSSLQGDASTFPCWWVLKVQQQEGDVVAAAYY